MTLFVECYGVSWNCSVVNKPQDNRNCKIAVKDTDSNVCLGYQPTMITATLPMFLSNETLITTAFPVSATNSEDL